MTDTTEATTIADHIDVHLRAYCEPDLSSRRSLFESVWAPTGELVDPPFAGTGVEEIAALVDVVLQHYPAHRFERTTEVDTHHRSARYGWALVAPDGTPAVTGTDVVDLTDDGKIARIVGFFGEPTPAARG